MRTSIAPDPPSAVRFHSRGTTAAVAVADPAVRDEAAAILVAELDAIDAACNRIRSDSELARLNGAAGRWVPVSRLFLAALDVALTAARATDGLIDPTIGRALRVVGSGRDLAGGNGAGESRRFRVVRTAGWRAIEIDVTRRRVRLPRGVVLDLGEMAAAFSADRAARRIADVTGTGVFVSLAGDCSIAGPAPARGFAVPLTDAADLVDAGAGTPAAITCHAGGVSTARPSSARRSRRPDERRGPAEAAAWRAVTVAAPTCVDAHMYATTALTLGCAAPRWLETARVAARLVATDGAVTTTRGWPHPATASGAA